MGFKSYHNGNVVTDKQTQIRDGIYCFEKYIINHTLTILYTLVRISRRNVILNLSSWT